MTRLPSGSRAANTSPQWEVLQLALLRYFTSCYTAAALYADLHGACRLPGTTGPEAVQRVAETAAAELTWAQHLKGASLSGLLQPTFPPQRCRTRHSPRWRARQRRIAAGPPGCRVRTSRGNTGSSYGWSTSAASSWTKPMRHRGARRPGAGGGHFGGQRHERPCLAGRQWRPCRGRLCGFLERSYECHP
jgi:hypothetical protein